MEDDMETEELKVLIIEDSDADFLLTERYLSQNTPGARCRRVDSRQELEVALRAEDWDVILSDYTVPGMDFLETKGLIHALRPDVPVILVSGNIGEEQAVELIKQGVWDFVLKDNMVRLELAIRRAVQEAEDRRARSLAEQALRASENEYRILFESIPGMILTKDSNFNFLTCNHTFARDIGIQPEELAGHTDYDFFPKDLADKYRADDRRIMESGIQETIEERYVRPGYEGWIQTVKTPIRDEDGKICGILSIFWDVTQRRLAEQRLQEQAKLLDITSDAVFVRDMRHDIVYWNQSAQRIFGWSASEAIGKNADELLGICAPESMLAYQIILEKGEWVGELHRKSRDGRELTVQARWTLVREPNGKPRGILAVNTDVTEQRSIQQQLLRAQRLESVGTLAGGIAHDLNNILSPILMGVEGLSLQHSDENSRKILDIIKTAAQRGANIVRQVLSFARGIEGEQAEVQPKHIIREVEELIKETFPKTIEIRSQVSKDLLPVTGDATQLHQVLINLCVNARDAMPEGGVLTLSADNVQLDETYARMHIEAKPIRYVVLKVEDTGTGMPPGIVEKIFDPFFTTKGSGKGTGLGLSTVHSIARSHGGFITVYSEVDKGSAFRIYIPAVERGETAGMEKVLEGIPMGEGEMVLVAEDEAAVREITKQILEAYGYKVLLAKDGTEALVHFAKMKEEIQVVVTDMMMPFMDGAATIRALRKISPTAKIIATSGLATSANETAGLGVNSFLAKPYTAEALLGTLRKVLGAAQRSAPT
jgi:PAS domain S-box-containing protein